MSAPRTLHIGFIGLGEHQTRAHIKHLVEMANSGATGAQLVFVGAFDPGQGAFEQVEQATGLKLARFESAEALLESTPLDVVFISSPDEFHMEQLRMAVRKNLHVFCEKPIAVAAQHRVELFDVLEEAAARGLVVSTCHPRRMDPPFLFIQEKLPQWVAKYGPLNHFDFSFLYHEVTDEWKKNRSLLSDHYGHEIDILRFLCGPKGFAAQKITDGYDCYEVMGVMDGGPSFRFYGSRALPESVYNEYVRLDFAKGVLFFNLNRGHGLELHNNVGFNFPAIDYDARFFAVNLNFIGSVLGTAQPYLTARDILTNNATSVDLTEHGVTPPRA